MQYFKHIQMRSFVKFLAGIFLAGTISGSVYSQQIADTAWHPEIVKPEYAKSGGPVVFIDGGHFNFHTKDGRYQPFAMLLERDGYVVKASTGEFKKPKLAGVRILVIANALNKLNEQNWFLPTPSAFTKTEIETITNWVNEGGSLFLIADHMPFAGAAAELAAVFGFEFSNGFALDTTVQGPSVFKTGDSTLIESLITRGKGNTEGIHQIVTFTGQAFRYPPDAIPVLVFDKRYLNFLPDTAWRFDQHTRKFSIAGWSQGAYKKFGKGRVAAFGEAAMFTAQLAGPAKTRVGMNADNAKENYRLLLNIIHWLDAKTD